MRRKLWHRKRRKENARREQEKNLRLKAGHVYIDGVLLGRHGEIDICNVKEIKVTGILYSEVMEFADRFIYTAEDPVVELLDFSEAIIPEEEERYKSDEEKIDKNVRFWYPTSYNFARRIIAPSNCTKTINSPHSMARKLHTEELVVKPDHPYLKSVDGVIYSKDGAQLMCYPVARTAKSYTLLPETQSIGCGAFIRNTLLEEIILNDGLLVMDTESIIYLPNLKHIGFGTTLWRMNYWAVFGCDNLEEVLLPASLEEYKYSAIEGCKSLRRIDVAEGGETFCSIDGVLYNKKLAALVRCPKAYDSETLTISDWVKTILSESVKSCVNLRHLHLPKSLEQIESDSISCCENLESITIDEDNKHFCINGGILYSADRARLIHCPPMLDLEEFTVPDAVVRIDEYAFCRNQNIRRMTIPESVKEVGHCFINETRIEEMWLPATPPVVKEGINQLFRDDQYVGYPARGYGYKNFHIPKGSKKLYEDDSCIWKYVRDAFIEDGM